MRFPVIIMVKDDMRDKVVLITGATSGIGKATAEGLAEKGASLVLVGRSDDRLAKLCEEMERRFRAPTPQLLRADLSSMAEVRRLASTIMATNPRLDVLINNAGTIVGGRQLTADGFEYTFALDHLSPFLLTNLLLDLLKSSAPSRIITISSVWH